MTRCQVLTFFSLQFNSSSTFSFSFALPLNNSLRTFRQAWQDTNRLVLDSLLITWSGLLLTTFTALKFRGYPSQYKQRSLLILTQPYQRFRSCLWRESTGRGRGYRITWTPLFSFAATTFTLILYIYTLLQRLIVSSTISIDKRWCLCEHVGQARGRKREERRNAPCKCQYPSSNQTKKDRL